MPFERNCLCHCGGAWATSEHELVAWLRLWREVWACCTHWMRVKVLWLGLRLNNRHRKWLSRTWIGLVLMLLLVHKSWASFDTFSIGGCFHLVSRDFHVELADATAGIESDTRGSSLVAFIYHLTLDTGWTVRLNTLFHCLGARLRLVMMLVFELESTLHKLLCLNLLVL